MQRTPEIAVSSPPIIGLAADAIPAPACTAVQKNHEAER